jgi:tRNA 2-selenouridine synthase
MKVDAERFLELSETYSIVDVRSPAEFEQGHIPGAVNIPLFSNEERAVVGTLYKQSGRFSAVLKGLDIAGPKMSGFLKKAVAIAKDKKGLVHCWRGGMRCESMAWLFARGGLEAVILEGGYKAYRRHIREQWNNDITLVVIGGMTGSGKTALLHKLDAFGEQVIDLEGRANHKGSAFGAIGQHNQPTSEQFENNLAGYWKTLSCGAPVFIEDESRSVGSVSLPESLFFRMRQAPVIHIDVPKKYRVERLVREYAAYSNDLLADAISRITKRLGGQNAKAALQALNMRDYETVADITLTYYDKAYLKGLANRDKQTIHTLKLESNDVTGNAEKLLEFYQENFIE